MSYKSNISSEDVSNNEVARLNNRKGNSIIIYKYNISIEYNHEYWRHRARPFTCGFCNYAIV